MSLALQDQPLYVGRRKQPSISCSASCAVADRSIPLHQLPVESPLPTRVEHILPAHGPVINDVHRHDYHEVFLFRSGSGTHMIDLRDLPIAAPSIHLVAPGQVHRLDRSADMEGMVVMFSDHVLPDRARAAHLSAMRSHHAASFPLHAEEMDEACQLVQQMERELARGAATIPAVVESYLGILLLKCAQWSRVNGGADAVLLEEHDPVRRFLELLEQRYLLERQVGTYAALLSMTPDHLNELVKERLGRTASNVVQDRLLLEAKRLLVHGDRSVKEIAFALNMNDPAYFTRWFGKMEGLSPARFRDSYKP